MIHRISLEKGKFVIVNKNFEKKKTFKLFLGIVFQIKLKNRPWKYNKNIFWDRFGIFLGLEKNEKFL